MPEITTDCHIAAPPARVWALLTDFPRYPEWHTMLRAAEGTAAPGERLRITIPVGPVGLTFTTVIERCEEDTELRWTWRLPPLVRAEHYFRLTEESGGTRLTHGESFGGLVGWMVPTIARLRPAAYARLNVALKERVEATS